MSINDKIKSIDSNRKRITRLRSTIFVFEETNIVAFLAGLDASSSLELLNHLNLVAESGRLVLLTIHQPRLEIFHLFHKILLLCDGQVRGLTI